MVVVSDGPDPLEGRHLYGQDPAVYALGRPDYPPRVYHLLISRCGLTASSRVLEIGPGTGLVTRRLLDVGARVTAVEPDPAMAHYLTQALPEPRLDIVVQAFEDASLAASAFDVAVAANSFHWVAQPRGLQQLGRAIRSDGWVALWGMLFEDPTTPDDLSRLVEDLVGKSPGSDHRQLPSPFDQTSRRAELSAAGFVDIDSELLRDTIELDPLKARALYASMTVILRRTAEQRPAVLDAIEAAVRDRFGGCVQRQTVGVIYTARNP